jgi:hypothetical protein
MPEALPHPDGPEDEDFDDEDDIAAEHAAMLAGDELARALHDPEECYQCLVSRPAVISICRCAECWVVSY